MKTFRSIKYRSLKKQSPLGHIYRFLVNQDITATFKDVFYQEDENWMVLLTTHTGQNLLKWTNQPEELLNVVPEFNTVARKVVKLVDTPGFVRQDILPDMSAGKTKSQIEAEINLALNSRRLEDINDGIITEEESVDVYKELVKSIKEVSVLNKVEEEILVTPEIIVSKEEVIETEHEPITAEEALAEEPKVSDLEFFKAEFIKNKDFGKFVIEMKQEFNVDEIEALCAEIGIEYIKPKAKAIKMIAEKLGE